MSEEKPEGKLEEIQVEEKVEEKIEEKKKKSPSN